MREINAISILSIALIYLSIRNHDSNQILAFHFKPSTNNHKRSNKIPISIQNTRRSSTDISLFAKSRNESEIFLRDKKGDRDRAKSNNEEEIISFEESPSSSSNSSSGGKLQVLSFVALSFITLSTIAQYGILSLYSAEPPIHRDQGAFLITSVLAISFVKLCTWSANKGWIESRDSRKIIHTFSAPLFIFVWPLFSNAYGARFFAALIPLTNALRLYNAGSGKGGDESELASAVSRSGNKDEALGGPFIYVIILFFSTLLFWVDNLSGVVSMTAMAVGDGTADLVGRRLGKSNKWPFNKDKSIAGSTAFFIFSFIATVALSLWLNFTGVIPLTMPIDSFISRIAIISLICAFVELIPFGDDNWTVPITAAALSQILL